MNEIVFYNFAFALAVHQREDLLALRMIDVVAVAHRDASYELMYIEAHSSLLFLAKLAQERWLDFESKLRSINDDGTCQILIDHGRSEAAHIWARSQGRPPSNVIQDAGKRFCPSPAQCRA